MLLDPREELPVGQTSIRPRTHKAETTALGATVKTSMATSRWVSMPLRKARVRLPSARWTIDRKRSSSAFVRSLRRAGRTHHLGIGTTHACKRVLALADEHHITVNDLTTGEVLSAHLIDPNKTNWRNAQPARGRCPSSQT
jgi:hypothetical protein